ncbi:MAG: Mammalian cell entry related domain protein [Marmoricola sp.]|nr:Mammalian cell entry related domain protein [Marmoricola sp.]
MTDSVTPDFKARSLSFRAGLIVLVVIGAMLYLTFKAQTGMPFAKTTQVQAYVNNIHSLKVNDLVRQNSKRIGRVSAIDYSHGAALVTMSIDGDAHVYKNATTTIGDVSALATKFIDLNPGTPSAGVLSAPIPTSQTSDSVDLYQLLDVLDPTTRDAATSTLRNVGGGLAGHGGDLHAFLASAPDSLKALGTISGALASNKANLPQLLNEVNTLSSHLVGRQQQLATLIKQSDATFQAVGAGSGAPLRKTVFELPNALMHVNHAMSSLQQPLHQTGLALRALEPGAKALGRSDANLRGFLRDAVPVAAQVPAVAAQSIPAVEDLTKTFADAQPLADQVEQALADLLPPLQYLAPYAVDMQELFLRGRSFVSEGPRPGVRYARLGVTPGVNTITGAIFPSSNLPQDNYPAPGVAQFDRAKGLLPTGLLPGGKK